MPGPERFTAFGGTFCKIERSAAPELYALALRFPEAFSRALRHAGYLLRGELKAALRGSGGLRASWPGAFPGCTSTGAWTCSRPGRGAVDGGIMAGVSSSSGGSDTGAFPGASG